MPKFFSTDERFMVEALKLAKRGLGHTNPNPMVGAVIVKNGKIIARGYHKKVGGPHAEIEALCSAKASVKGATLYCNLEPCSHYGRTPPCVDAVIKAGISRVVCSTRDPNPKVCGRGILKLRQAGIAVSVGPQEKKAKVLNETFFTFHEKKRPFAAIKFAASLDGKLATRTGDSKWITNEKARAFARGLRGQYQAILVGIDTILRDNSHLGTRQKSGKDPLRIVLDSKLRIPETSKVLRDGNVLILTTELASKKKKELLKHKGVEVLILGGKTISVTKLLTALWKRDIVSVLVEGGGKVLGSFVDAKIVDKVYAFYAPIIVGGDKATSIRGRGVARIKDAKRLQNIYTKHFGDNFLVVGYPSGF